MSPLEVSCYCLCEDIVIFAVTVIRLFWVNCWFFVCDRNSKKAAVVVPLHLRFCSVIASLRLSSREPTPVLVTMWATFHSVCNLILLLLLNLKLLCISLNFCMHENKYVLVYVSVFLIRFLIIGVNYCCHSCTVILQEQQIVAQIVSECMVSNFCSISLTCVVKHDKFCLFSSLCICSFVPTCYGCWCPEAKNY